MNHNILIPFKFRLPLIFASYGGENQRGKINCIGGGGGEKIKGAKIKGSENLRQAKFEGTKVLLKTNTLAEMLLQLQSND